MDNNLYREEILEHYKNPQNFGRLSAFDACSKQVNPFCGDEMEMSVKFNNNKIEQVKFKGRGCAISIAAGSMLTEYSKNKTIGQLTKFSEKDMLSLLGIEVSQVRRKCALLGLFTLRNCLIKDK